MLPFIYYVMRFVDCLTKTEDIEMYIKHLVKQNNKVVLSASLKKTCSNCLSVSIIKFCKWNDYNFECQV